MEMFQAELHNFPQTFQDFSHRCALITRVCVLHSFSKLGQSSHVQYINSSKDRSPTLGKKEHNLNLGNKAVKHDNMLLSGYHYTQR